MDPLLLVLLGFLLVTPSFWLAYCYSLLRISRAVGRAEAGGAWLARFLSKALRWVGMIVAAVHVIQTPVRTGLLGSIHVFAAVGESTDASERARLVADLIDTQMELQIYGAFVAIPVPLALIGGPWVFWRSYWRRRPRRIGGPTHEQQEA